MLENENKVLLIFHDSELLKHGEISVYIVSVFRKY
jgi:hypothetical protein